MSLADRLTDIPVAGEHQGTPRTEFDGQTGYLQTAPLDKVPTDFDELLTEFGYDPATVRIVGTPRVSRWQKYTGEWLSAYRFHIALRTAGVDVEELIADIGCWKPGKPASPVTGDGVFVFQASDLQLGKDDNDGLEGIVARYMSSVEAAVAELKVQRKRHGITVAHLVFVGDCLEGNQSQGGRLVWRTSLTITEQTRVWRRMLLATIKAFAPHVGEVVVSVVNGNHDEAQRLPVQTRPDDGWATEGAIAVADACAESGKLSHVRVQVPPIDQGFMTVKVGGSVFTLAHGHQWRKGKAADWWASQAFYQGNPAGADFLCHGHWHSTSISQDGPRTIICSPTFDGGSNWYRDKTGAVSRQGGLVYITHGPDFSGLTLV